ncbi:uncharacterized protein VTP21DRAFT_3746 [Calcarisporiella thermophila]|uniref:uncharacterized protein n=1 Tax=Calcarisporiella thermophila TaxID=911321 RepID=UPI0037427E00
MSRNMQSLLQWAIANSDPEQLSTQAQQPPSERPNYTINRELIDAVLGKDDPTRMREAADIIASPSSSFDARLAALEELQELVEQIDNACNLENMQLWPLVLKQLQAEEPEIRAMGAWCCGSALQNNPRAQKAFLKAGGLEALMPLLEDESQEVKAKAVGCVSGSVRNCQEALREFEDRNGWALLAQLLVEGQASVVRKVVFLYQNVMLDEENVSARLWEEGMAVGLERVLREFQDDEDLVAKSLRTLHTFLKQQHANVTVPSSLKECVQEVRQKYTESELDDNEWKELDQWL